MSGCGQGREPTETVRECVNKVLTLVSFLDPLPKKKGGSGEYSTASHYGLAVAMESAKSQAFEIFCWASVN